MGGIVSDFWGRSTLAGLSVCGECSSTGAHGANRLASNSLLEAVVFAERISRRLNSAVLDAPAASEAVIPAALTEQRLLQLRCP
jgi:L-aspartate oxidase